MPADNEHDPLDRWLNQQVRPLPPPAGTFELITKRARRRRIRKAVISVASAAAVAAAVGVAVPVSMSLHLNPTPTNASLANGAAPTSSAASQSTLGSANKQPSVEPTQPASSGATTPRSNGTTSPGPAVGGYLPPNFQPNSVTWDSLSTGWVIGPAGTPGHCANPDPDICTSVARTDDGGQNWQGVPAPNTGNGVTGLRFLNASYGWAFGPELWATVDGGQHWHQVNTGNLCVSQLETINGRAYALFASCTSTNGATRAHYTLMTAMPGSDNWTPVAGVPGNFTETSGPTDLAVIELVGTTGYLVAPDGTLYAGPLDGTAWHRVTSLPCAPGTQLMTPAGVTPSGAQRLAMVCTALPANTTSVYLSQDGGSTWTQQAGVVSLPAATTRAESLTALPDGTLILAALAISSPSSGGGIYLLSPGATQWQPAQLSDPSGLNHGFTYVGMTSATQGVALGGDPNLHAIWMTTDGGKTWQVRPIQK
jgi:photosystem II stability/assembly factor-like uncharacterized protein